MQEMVSRDLFDAHSREGDDRYKMVNESIKDLYSKVENRVTYKEFTWVLGILITILVSVLGYIAYQVSENRQETKEVSKTVSQIQGKLEPYGKVEYKD